VAISFSITMLYGVSLQYQETFLNQESSLLCKILNISLTSSPSYPRTFLNNLLPDIYNYFPKAGGPFSYTYQETGKTTIYEILGLFIVLKIGCNDRVLPNIT